MLSCAQVLCRNLHNAVCIYIKRHRVKEHPEEWKELEHMLYYSEANFHKRVAPDTLEDLDIKHIITFKILSQVVFFIREFF